LLGLAKRPQTIEVTVTTAGRPARDFVVHRSTDLIAAEVAVIKGIPCTNAARSIVDSGIPWGEGFAGRCLKEAVRQGLVTDQDVARVLHRVARRGRNGVGPMRIVLAERMGLLAMTESELEDCFLRIMKAAGVELPDAQVRIHERGGRLIARVDFVYHQFKLVIEIDGVAFHSDSKSFRRDRRNQNALVLAGYRVLRFTYFDLVIAPEYVVSQVVEAINQSR
jgi:very-short-patch-repair endonuclease